MKIEFRKTNKQQLSKILQTYQPLPGEDFYRRMANAPWNTKELMKTENSLRLNRFSWQLAIAMVIVLMGLSLAIPTVRASVSAWLGLSVAPSDQMPSTSVNLVEVTSTPASDNSDASKQSPTEDPLSAEAGWNILTASNMPEGYKFDNSMLDSKNQMVITSFTATRSLPGADDPTLTETKTITLLQALHNDFIPMEVAPSAAIEDILINEKPGVYTIGAWDSEFVPDSNDPNGGKMISTWRNDLSIQNIYWQVGNVYLVLLSDDPQVKRQDLLLMAASIGN